MPHSKPLYIEIVHKLLLLLLPARPGVPDPAVHCGRQRRGQRHRERHRHPHALQEELTQLLHGGKFEPRRRVVRLLNLGEGPAQIEAVG